MKKLLTTILLILTLFGINYSSAEVLKNSDMKVFESDNKKYYGLKNNNDEVVVDAKYRKLIRLGENSWIIQQKNYRFGLIDNNGNILVEPKYVHVERLFDKWVKLGNTKDYGLYDEYGKTIIPPKYKAIEPLFGSRFLTYKNYKYGVYNDKGEEILENKYDFIYMPNPKTMRIKYDGYWYEIEQIAKDDIVQLPDTVIKEFEGEKFRISQMVKNTGVGAGYGLVTATDYTLKIFSAFSSSYEETIDELMLSKGVETVSILMKFKWIPKFPIVFVQKYYENIFKPDNSPLSGIRNELKEQIK